MAEGYTLPHDGGVATLTVDRPAQRNALDVPLVEDLAATLSTLARQQTTLLAALPPRYSEVLLNLLDRLESSALFSEESCSFSQKDLVANLTMWVEKAQGTLNAS